MMWQTLTTDNFFGLFLTVYKILLDFLGIDPRPPRLYAPRRVIMCDRIHMCDMTRQYVWHDSHMCDMTRICVTWLVNMCDMTRQYICWDSFIYVTWLIHTCAASHLYMWLDSFTCVPRLYAPTRVFTCDRIHSQTKKKNMEVGSYICVA